MLIPKSRLLIPFDQRPFHVLEKLEKAKAAEGMKEKKKKANNNSSCRFDSVLVLWMFEDQLKRQYATFVANLEVRPFDHKGKN